MFNIEAIKKLISNQLNCIKGLEKQGNTYTKYVNGSKVNIHITQIHCQVFRDSYHQENFRINAQHDFKNAEVHAKYIVGQIKKHLD